MKTAPEGRFSVGRMLLMAAVLLPAVLLAGPHSSFAGEQTDAPEVISEDATWKGVVEVTGEVVVDVGASLVILPGSTIRFAARDGEEEPKARLIVRGRLVALGTPGGPVLFTSAASDPKAGDWGGILFDKANDRVSRLLHCRIEYARDAVIAGLSTISMEETTITSSRVGFTSVQKINGGLFKCRITENRVGLYFNESSGVIVENCEISGNSEKGVFCTNASSPIIRNCEILSNNDSGIHCTMGSSPLLERNLIRGNKQGVRLELNSRPMVARNELRDNGTAIWAEKKVFPDISRNIITANGVGIYLNFSAYPVIRGNAVYGNEKYAVVLGDNQSIEVEGLIPFRDKGRYYDEAPESEFLPAKTRKHLPFGKVEKNYVDARGNWWGDDAAAELGKIGDGGNASFLEDGRDKPTVRYGEKEYPRDLVAFSPWEEKMPEDAGRPVFAYSGIRGKTLLGGEPLAGALVHAYPEAGDGFRGEGMTYSVTGRDGTFSMNLAPGRYFLVVKAPDPLDPGSEPGPGGFFGYYGGNPVAVTKGEWTESNIQAVSPSPPDRGPEEGLEGALLRGVVTGPDGPVEGAAVYVYPDSSSEFRGPGLMGPRGAVPGGTGPDGSFEIELPPSRFYVVASKRKNGAALGPLGAGDLYGYYDGNPLDLKNGQWTAVTISMVEKVRETVKKPSRGRSGISGVIRDASGNVPEGVYAFASTELNVTGGMPPFRSHPVGPDGEYFIDTRGGGAYYVGARTGYGGPPLPGESYGLYGEGEPVPVDVPEGMVTGNIDITVEIVK